jgi:benzylsuccinate CoA-transferase BbsE subunit
MEAHPGPLTGLRVVELANEPAALAGKMLAELGADVVLVEPPGGDHTRSYAPFADDEPGLENSLWWASYHTSKRSIVLDRGTPADREILWSLLAAADVVLEAETPGTLASLDLHYSAIALVNPSVIWTAVTAYGQQDPRSLQPDVDLTMLAAGGPVWLCGYDDHAVAPVRGGGNQGYHIAATFAVMATLTALYHRQAGGGGQFVDVNMHAAASVTTESGSFEYLVAGTTVQRQTGRHAMSVETENTLVQCQDDVYVTTGFPPREPRLFRALLDWLADIGTAEEFASAPFLEMGADGEPISMSDIGSDPVVTEIYRTGRAALVHIAERLAARDFFAGAQERGLVCGIIYSPDEVLSDPHFQARGFPVEVEGVGGRREVHAGAPFIAAGSPWRLVSRAPMLGEHQAAILAELAESTRGWPE